MPVLRWISILLIFLAVLLSVLQLVRYSRVRASFPPGTVIAGVDVTGLDRQKAAERLIQVYSTPVEVRYSDAAIQLKPSNLGFELDLETMMAAADQQRISQPFWTAFWDYLWNQIPSPPQVPLRATISEERLQTYLEQEVAVRYDLPAAAAAPKPGSTSFEPGRTGTILDVDRAVILIQDALRSPTSRIVNLSFNTVSPPKPAFANLEVQLKQVIDVLEFDGLTEVYLLDLQTGQEVNFAYQNGQSVPSDVAFTAASTMKIPVMVSVFRRLEEPLPDAIDQLIFSMIELSQNEPADQLMEQVMDRNLGPLDVTADLQALGLQNTFLAGYFYPGAPLLKAYTTPANQRTDVTTGPDRYNQT
ncbi:MAG TPA: hypothetical protein VFF68_06290, partial [Anaerolineaceae bacterium]|nr:hypothetical protein [Anaerolineaceae bacterium]